MNKHYDNGMSTEMGKTRTDSAIFMQNVQDTWLFLSLIPKTLW